MEPMNFAMFSDKGNEAVHRGIDSLIASGPTHWDKVMKMLHDVSKKENMDEAMDTAVRDAVFDYITEKRMLLDVEEVALHPEQHLDPLPKGTIPKGLTYA